MKDMKLVQERSDSQTVTEAEMIRGYASGQYHLQETMPFVFPLYTSYRQTDRQTIGLSFLQDIKTCCLSVFLHLYPYSPTI